MTNAAINKLENCFLFFKEMPPKYRRGGGLVRAAPHFTANRDDREDDDPGANAAKRFAEIARRNEIDLQMGFPPFHSGPSRIGWMINMQSVIQNHCLVL